MDSLIIENASLKAELAEANRKLSWLMEQLSSRNRTLYGQSSEKSVYDNRSAQIGLFSEAQEAAVVETDTVDEPAPEPQPTAKQRPKKKGELGTRLPEGLPVETVERTLSEEERACPQCGDTMRPIGKELARRELKIVPAKAVVVEYWRSAYACGDCERDAETVPVVKAPMPPQVIKGSICAPETVAHIIHEKCVMGTPLYRQEKSWNRNGIPITRQTMASWLIRCSKDYFEHIYLALRLLLCQMTLLYSDDTVFQVLREPGKPAQSESRMWLYRTGADAEHPIVLYDYQPDRRKERPREFLAGYSGYLVCDGYAAYHSLPEDIIVIGCFAHVRRKFDDALKCLKEDDRPGSLAFIGKGYCDRLFAIDRDAKEFSFAQRYEHRMENAAPVLDEFRAWLDSVAPHVSTKSKLGIAVTYAVNQWKYLIRYLLDGRIECSNNLSERSVKPFVINRKNFLFATSVDGARAAAVLQSLTETAIENGLNPFEYLAHVLRTAAGCDLANNPELVQRLLPHNAPVSCHVMC
jgi:transposase